MQPRRIVRLCFLAVILIAVCAGNSSAQLFPGRITGVVKDTQGGAVAGATVKLSNPSTGLERAATTDENGEFNFSELSLGTYRLTVSKSGFQTMLITDIVTSQGAVNTFTPTLTVGTVTSVVEVTSAPPLLQTETNSVGGQLSEQQVTSLPIGNSDYTRLALVLPGVTQNSNFAFAQYTINAPVLAPTDSTSMAPPTPIPQPTSPRSTREETRRLARRVYRWMRFRKLA